jgi:hypothetical protein
MPRSPKTIREPRFRLAKVTYADTNQRYLMFAKSEPVPLSAIEEELVVV